MDKHKANENLTRTKIPWYHGAREAQLKTFQV